jgi:hypothetical protein
MPGQRLGTENCRGIEVGALCKSQSSVNNPSARVSARRFSPRGDDIAGVFCVPEHPGARPDALRVAAQALGIVVIQLPNLQGDAAAAAMRDLDSVQAYTDIASVRGVGLSLIGLSAVEAFDGRPEKPVQIAAAAEIYAHRECIVNVYSDDTRGRAPVDEAMAALSGLR